MTRAWLVVGCTLSACAFRPSLDDTALVDCDVDADCPRGARCIAQVCVPQPLRITSLTATPEVVEAGQECRFAAVASHSLGQTRLRYRWHQVLGPGVALAGDGSEVSLTTTAGYVGSYAVEVIVENGREPPVRRRAHCTALVSADAEWVVAGQNGDCSRERPCGSISQTTASRVYIGVDEAVTDSRTWTYSLSSVALDNRELHGGFLFPSWRRDMDRAHTALAAITSYWTVSCSSCLFSGFTQERLFPDSSSWRYVVAVQGTDVSLREIRVIMSGGSDVAAISGITATDPAVDSVTLEGVEVRADGLRANAIWGLDFDPVGVRAVDTEIDLRGATARQKTGVFASQQIEPVELDRVYIRLGDADEARGLVLECAAGRVVNTIVDARGDGADYSEALYIDSPQGCPTGGRIHSSLFAAGGGAASYGARLIDAEPSFDIVNTIIDGGQGFARVGLDAEGVDGAVDMSGTVIVLDGGELTRDHWVRSASAGLPLDAFEAVISCSGCLSVAEGAAWVDAAAGDYHLTESSGCCIDTGAPLGPSDPTEDYDGVLRDPTSPASGPYELVLY